VPLSFSSGEANQYDWSQEVVLLGFAERLCPSGSTAPTSEDIVFNLAVAASA
jgi:hypothetical protein